MSASSSLITLKNRLEAAIGALSLSRGPYGCPELVERQTRQAEQMFQGYNKASPNDENSYSFARKFLDGQKLDDEGRYLVASALARPIGEHAGTLVLCHKKFPSLLEAYESEAKAGELSRLTWHGLLCSYFAFVPKESDSASCLAGWQKLREFLERTWPIISKEVGDRFVPDWVAVLRRETRLLSPSAHDEYARNYLNGDTAATDQLAADLGIPTSSWFWHALVLGAVNVASLSSDDEFTRLIPRLLALIKGKPGFRDDALELLLNRYFECKGAPPQPELRDFVCKKEVWGNPKLKEAGLATAWNRVSKSVWKMVLQWVNEGNLKDFFDILAARNDADDGRLAFWSRYLKQISWTRLVFGAATMELRRTNRGIRDLISREEGAYAELTGKSGVDAFMMQLGDYIIIEFSKKPNACYVYKADELPFEPYSKKYDGGSTDLGAGFNKNPPARILHLKEWEKKAAAQLEALGIRPDSPFLQRTPQTKDSKASESDGKAVLNQDAKTGRVIGPPDISALKSLVGRFRRATIDDKRQAKGGRLWVDDPLKRVQLETELVALGFKWAAKRAAWYYPEA
jgi:EH_Signature domain